MADCMSIGMKEVVWNVQENGIIRDKFGTLVGRIDDDYLPYENIISTDDLGMELVIKENKDDN